MVFMNNFNLKKITLLLKSTCLTVILGILLFSCTSVINLPCVQHERPDLIKTTIIPVKIGNFWKYLVHRSDNSPDSYNTTSITGMDTLFYNDESGSKSVVAYKIDLSSTSTSLTNNYMQFYYLVCDSNVIMVKSDETKLIRGWAVLNVFPENPQIGKIDFVNNKAWWKGTEEITTKFGKLSCYVWEKIETAEKVHFNNSGPNLKIIKADYTITRLYFSKGIGLVKTEIFDKKGRLNTSTELDSYQLK